MTQAPNGGRQICCAWRWARLALSTSTDCSYTACHRTLQLAVPTLYSQARTACCGRNKISCRPTFHCIDARNPSHRSSHARRNQPGSFSHHDCWRSSRGCTSSYSPIRGLHLDPTAKSPLVCSSKLISLMLGTVIMIYHLKHIGCAWYFLCRKEGIIEELDMSYIRSQLVCSEMRTQNFPFANPP